MRKEKKGIIMVNKVKVTRPGTNQAWFTMRMIAFNPDVRFVGTDEAKEYWRKKDRIGKQKMKEEYCSLFATVIEVGRGKKKHLEFNKVPKNAADCIIIVPTRWRSAAWGQLDTLEMKLTK